MSRPLRGVRRPANATTLVVAQRWSRGWVATFERIRTAVRRIYGSTVMWKSRALGRFFIRVDIVRYICGFVREWVIAVEIVCTIVKERLIKTEVVRKIHHLVLPSSDRGTNADQPVRVYEGIQKI